MAPVSSYDYRQERGVFGGVTYAYRVAPPTPPTVSTKWALLLHGFPAGTHSWRFVIPALVAKGYHVVIPDMLGYGGTDKPLALEDYKGKKMCASLIAIMDKEGADKFITAGHDWGTFPASRMGLWYPDRVSGVALAAVGYTAPAPGAMDLEAIKAATLPILGYDNLSYWNLFGSDDAGPLMDKHLDTFLKILFAQDQNDGWRVTFCDHVQFRNALEEDRDVATAAYLTSEDFNIYGNELSDGAFTARFNWYRSGLSGQNWSDEKDLPVIKTGERIHLKMPVLYVLCDLDIVCVPALQKGGVGHIQDLTIELVQSDHWVMESKPEEFNAVFGKWIDDKVEV